MAARHAPGAFTLVEVLVVLAIIGLATAVVAPALRPPAGRGAARAAADLARAFAAARSAAVGRGVVTTVQVDLVAGSYRVLAASPGGATWDAPAPGAPPPSGATPSAAVPSRAMPSAAAPDTVRAGVLALPAGARMHAGRVRDAAAGATRWRSVAVFDPLGRARGDDVVIEHGGRRYRVEVDAWTAVARVVSR